MEFLLLPSNTCPEARTNKGVWEQVVDLGGGLGVFKTGLLLGLSSFDLGNRIPWRVEFLWTRDVRVDEKPITNVAIAKSNHLPNGG